MSKETVQGFLLGVGAGVLVACFLKAPEEIEVDDKERRKDAPSDRNEERAPERVPQ